AAQTPELEEKLRLQGKWLPVAVEFDGKPAPGEVTPAVEFFKDRLELISRDADGREVRRATPYELDVKPTPFVLTVFHDAEVNGKVVKQPQYALLERKGDTLKIRWHLGGRQDLPGTFDAPKGYVVTFKRQRPQ